MNGKDRMHLQNVIWLMFTAYKLYLNSSYAKCVAITNFGKGDTLGLDKIPEVTYMNGIKCYDPGAVFITEETDNDTYKVLPDSSDPKLQPPVLISDPIDRSKFLKMYLDALFMERREEAGLKGDNLENETEEYKKEFKAKVEKLASETLVKDLEGKFGSPGKWEGIASPPISVSGATSAISSVNNGKIIFSVIVNYLNGDMYIACEAGIRVFPLSKAVKESDITLEKIFASTKTIKFLPLSAFANVADKFISFTGKSGYMENLRDSGIIENISKSLLYSEPGGPARVLYLSNLQGKAPKLGFIVYNGEKITEWIHALAFVKFARTNLGRRALSVYEVSIKRAYMKDGILMSTSPVYSIFNRRNGSPFIDLNKLKDYDSPSHYRSLLVIAPEGNLPMNLDVANNNIRDISCCL